MEDAMKKIVQPIKKVATLACAVACAMALAHGTGIAGSWSEDQFHSMHPGEQYQSDTRPNKEVYSFAVNTYPDGWAALKAEPWGGSRRMTKVYEGTLFLVIGSIPGWKLVRFKSGEQGWIAERLVGCCRPASN